MFRVENVMTFITSAQAMVPSAGRRSSSPPCARACGGWRLTTFARGGVADSAPAALVVEGGRHQAGASPPRRRTRRARSAPRRPKRPCARASPSSVPGYRRGVRPASPDPPPVLRAGLLLLDIHAPRRPAQVWSMMRTAPAAPLLMLVILVWCRGGCRRTLQVSAERPLVIGDEVVRRRFVSALPEAPRRRGGRRA